MLRRPRGPQLLLLVYVLGLCLTLGTAATLAFVVGNDLTNAAVQSSVDADQSLVRAFVAADLTERDMQSAVDPARAAELQRLVDGLHSPELVRIKLYRSDTTVLMSDDRSLVGTNFGLHDDIAQALGGTPSYDLKTDFSDEEADQAALGFPVLLEEYLPVKVAGTIPAAFEMYRDPSAILAKAGGVQRAVFGVTLVAALLLTVLLTVVFRSADRRLKRQTRELVEATRRDALTGTLNHGAVVAQLAADVEAAEASRTGEGAGRAAPAGQPVALALIDIDNFRLLNDTHGHAAGDVALRQVADLLIAAAPVGSTIGRYGPDELLLVANGASVAELQGAVARFRTCLGDVALQFGASERLPVTVSAGLCSYPMHGRSVTELLTRAAVALSQARASGGDQVRVAEAAAVDEGGSERASFDVLQGLVIAVDTKDRYTKRHSEDVARYALFLADRLGLPPEWRRTLHLAGLLHDIGKIGIPDTILRKPGPLEPGEHAIVQQHVALGHMIVRDLPHLELVRAGVRFHHERWDGGGYLEGLQGDDIPPVARILAVADAFSAMTTSRPYRKALSLREALGRLEDAAGTQLDPRLVIAFVMGMETAADAPIPGTEQAPLPRIWLPQVIEGRVGGRPLPAPVNASAGRGGGRQAGWTPLDGMRTDEVMTA